jgi:anti-sigma B factor antagonist
MKKNKPTFYPIFETKDQYTVIRLVGRLEAKIVNSDCHSTILEYIDKNHCILDLKNLSFIDSTGLTLFIKILKLSSISQNQCILYGMNSDIRQMFTVTKLINLFTIVADFTSAIRLIKKTK